MMRKRKSIVNPRCSSIFGKKCFNVKLDPIFFFSCFWARWITAANVLNLI